MKLTRPVTVAPRDQQRVALLAKLEGCRPSEVVAAALRLYYQLHEYWAIERGYDDPEISTYAEELCRLIGFDMVDEDDRPMVPAHRRRKPRVR